MASRSGAITRWLVKWLNDPARDWPRIEGDEWTAEQTPKPTVELEESSTVLTVQVSADSRGQNTFAIRSHVQRDLSVFIDVRQRFPRTGEIDDDWLDERIALVEAIDDSLTMLDLTNDPTGTVPTGYKLYVASNVIDPLCDRIDLEEFRQFTATIELTVRELKPRATNV